ncbi:hypothetical protein RHODO2019_03475 [Rhodococcus antarcticus]|uniref:Uncharacterized protein n=1 Tax=Rhodococcus antarcticus TaxID=2987751 RepID=A0ABY6P1K5_9NOCA|nr:hypothetical protein [Rhodococcus antarcticus]UZJ25540.1 hypothetical protein RHODO2019_03475 [Rhodococcus antarcticus]
MRRRPVRDDDPGQRAPADVMSRADDTLRRARQRNASVVTLDVAGSPADSCATVVIPRHVVTAADPHQADPDSTQVIRVRNRSA